MDNIKNNAYYIQKIRKDLEFIVTQMRDVDIEELNAKKLSDDYKLSHQYVPWNALSGMRNRIVHDYGNVDLNVVYETLKTDIPELIELLED